jgi:hypothetical protein
MRYLHSTLWLTLLAVVVLAQTASGQNAAPPVGPLQPQPERVVVGESCTVGVDRDGASLRFEGEFVKSSSRWIVLRRISEGRNDASVPLTSKIPFVTRKKSEVGVQTEYLWIPRQFAAVVSHSPAQRQVPLEHPLGDVPTPGARCEVTLVTDKIPNGKKVDKKKTRHDGTLVAVAKDKIMFDEERFVVERTGVPALNELPVVGRAFGSDNSHTEVVRTELALDDVACIRVVQPAMLQAEPPLPEVPRTKGPPQK